MPRPLAVLCLLPLAAAAAPAGAQIVYDAATGTSPSAQCWLYEGASAPAPSAGVIDFGSSSSSEYRYFYRTDVGGLDFNQGVVAEWEAFIVSGNYSANPCGSGQRAAPGFSFTDAQGRYCVVGLGADRVYITTEGNGFAGPNNPSAAFNTAGAWRTYRLELAAFTARLFIDGQEVLSVSRPAWPTSQSTANAVYFGGDTTSCGSGHARMRRFSISGFPNGGGPSQVTLATPPIDDRTCPGGSLTLNAAATSPLAITYRWQRLAAPDTWTDVADGPLPSGTIISGAATSALTLASASEADSGAQFRLVMTTSCGRLFSNAVTATIACRSIADVTSLGARPGCDGRLTADDVLVFLDAFFAGNLALADLAGLGGSVGADGQLTADDLIVFLTAFFAGCQ